MPVSRMNDVMVSVRMPQSLLGELKAATVRHHYMDVSETVRSIIRKEWMKSTRPELYEVRRLRENIEEQIRQKSVARITTEVARELEKIKSSLQKDLLGEK